MVIAPALIPKRGCDRVKTNRRDAITLARLHRAGELTSVWVPDATHEAIRDLVRAREAAADDLRRKRQQLLSFLLRCGRIYSGGGHWTLGHRRWLAKQAFEHAAQQIVFQEGIDAIEDAAQRLHRLEQQLAVIVPVGPWRRWLRQSGDARCLVLGRRHLRRGNRRRAPVRYAATADVVPRTGSGRELDRRYGETQGSDACWQSTGAAGFGRSRFTYRYPARVGETLRPRTERLPKPVRDIAWKAQLRLCARYRRLSAAGKKLPVVVAAIAREMATFLWAIGREVAPL
jgi:transposase